MLSFDYFYEVSLFFKHFKITQINKCYLWLFRRSGCCLWGVCDFTFLSWYLRSLCYPDKHLFFLLVIVWGKCKSVCPLFPWHSLGAWLHKRPQENWSSLERAPKGRPPPWSPSPWLRMLTTRWEMGAQTPPHAESPLPPRQLKRLALRSPYT